MQTLQRVIGIAFFILIFAKGTIGIAATDVTIEEQGQGISALYLKTDEPINSIEGVLAPGSGATIEEIRKGTIPGLWIISPEKQEGPIPFALAIPGGYRGEGIILTMRTTGNTPVLRDIHVLRNDGMGSEVVTTTGTRPMKVISSTNDHTPPGEFHPEITKDPTLFNGQWFVVFHAEDKESGIDHYEVMEVRPEGGVGENQWQDGQSPYLLKDQTRQADIYIRAVDHAGNFIIVHVPQSKNEQNEGHAKTIPVVLMLLLCIWIAGYIYLRLLRSRSASPKA